MAARRRPGDNGAVKASRPAWVIDVAIAVAATVASVGTAIAQTRHRGGVVYAIAGPHGGILVTHNPDLAARYARRVIRLVDGRIASDAVAGAQR